MRTPSRVGRSRRGAGVGHDPPRPPAAPAARPPPEAGWGVRPDASSRGPPAGPAAGPPKASLRRTFFGAACISLQPVLLSALMLPVTAYVIRGLGPTDYG